MLRHPHLLVFSRPFSNFSPMGTRLLGERVLGLGSRKRAVVFSARGVTSIRRVYSRVTLVGRSGIILRKTMASVHSHCGDGRCRLAVRSSVPLRGSSTFRVIDDRIRSRRAMGCGLQGLASVSGSRLLSLMNTRNRVYGFARYVPSVGSVFVHAMRKGVWSGGSFDCRRSVSCCST